MSPLFGGREEQAAPVYAKLSNSRASVSWARLKKNGGEVFVSKGDVSGARERVS